MSKFDLILLLIICLLAYACYLTNRRINHVLDRLASLSLSITGQRKEFAEALERHEKKNAEDVDGIIRRMDEFEEAGLENMRAQADAEKAFAIGVQTIMGYGAEIPHLKTGDMKNE